MKYQFILLDSNGAVLDRSCVHEVWDKLPQSLHMTYMRMRLSEFKTCYPKYKNNRVVIGTQKNGLLNEDTIELLPGQDVWEGVV